MKRNNINVSFTKEDTQLYEELNFESSTTYVPISVLIRNYVREGMKLKNKNKLPEVVAIPAPVAA